MSASTFKPYIDQLATAESVQEIGSIVRSLSELAGFDHFLFGMTVPTSLATPTNFVLSGFPKAWREEYDRNEFLRMDPVILHCIKSLSVVYWSDIQPRPGITGIFFDMAAQHGLVDGVTWPFAGRRGERGFFTLAKASPLTLTSEARDELTASIYWVCNYIYEAVIRVAFSASPSRVAEQDSPFAEAGQSLSTRQKEVLLLLASGLSAAEVGQRLNISVRTVWFHVEIAGRKLGATGKQEVIAKAQSSGAISLTEVGLRSGLVRPEVRNFAA